MGLSFDEAAAVKSYRFNDDSPNELNTTHQQIGNNSTSIPLQESERNEDNIAPSDPNILQRVESSSSIQEIRRSGDFQGQVCCDNPPLAFASNPEFTSDSANGV